MLQSNASANLAETTATHAILAASPMTVIDIGASGGLDPMWRRFEPNLRALCFDPLVNEIDRLRSVEPNPKVTYHDAWISANDPSIEADARKSGAFDAYFKSFSISSCMRAIELGRINYIKQQFNSGADVAYSSNRTSIDAFLSEQPEETIDFIKCDTDGHDYYVLRGADTTWAGKQVLGSLVECQFHGSSHEHANIFSNIDRYMKSQGFELFDIDVQRYTRFALPGRFEYELTASTKGGQVQWGDAVFFRDPVIWPHLLEPGNAVGTSAKQLKLVLLYDLFGLRDCAAQLILMLRDKGLCLSREAWTPLLDKLSQGNPLRAPSYDSYIKEFEADPLVLFPSRLEKLGNRNTESPKSQVSLESVTSAGGLPTRDAGFAAAIRMLFRK